jgi:uracil-DNA glycosylase
MGIKDSIITCEQCPLYKKMEYGPMTPFWVGKPRFIFVCDVRITKQEDETREFIDELNYTILTKSLNRAGVKSWYFTPLTKCKHINSIKHKKICSHWWIYREANILEKATKTKPLIIGLGKQVRRAICVYEEFPAITKICSSPKELAKFESAMTEIQKELDNEEN